MSSFSNTPTTLEERTVRFTKDELVKIDRVPCLNLDDLKEVAAYKPKDNDEYMLIECVPATALRRCPYCHRNTLTGNGHTTYPRLVHDVNVGLMQVDLSVSVPRYECQSCGGTVTHEFDSIMPGKQFTKRLYQQIKVDSFYDKFVDVAQRFGISDTKVADIFDEYAAELESKRGVIKAPAHHLAIDEKHVGHKMRGLFVDGDTGEILELTEDNSVDTMERVIRSMQGWENITHITTDMANGYKSVIENVFGSAVTVVVDKYHVLQDLTRKIVQCRTLIIEYINEKIRLEPDIDRRNMLLQVKKLVTDNAYLFKYGEDKLLKKPLCADQKKCTERDTCTAMVIENGKLVCPKRKTNIENLAIVCSTFPEFNHLRLIKESFELVYQCTSRKAAEEVFRQWCDLIPPTGKKQQKAWEEKYNVPAFLYEPIRPFYRVTNSTWNREIFNYFDEGSFITNAIAEGTNSFIEDSVIYGYSFARLRAKILFWHTAGSRTRYVINIRKKEKTSFDLPKTSYMDPYKTGYFTFQTPKTVYENVYGIYGEEIPNGNKPISVFSYLSSDARQKVQEYLDKQYRV